LGLAKEPWQEYHRFKSIAMNAPPIQVMSVWMFGTPPSKLLHI